MRYVPELTDKEIKDNHDILEERLKVYREKGLDFLKTRELILNKTGPFRGKILDVGSGKGMMALFLAKAGYDLVSIDNDETMLRLTALNLAYEGLLSKVELHFMDAYSLQFDDNSFDNVTMVEALHHMDDIDGLLAEMDRVFSGRGKIILADFNKKGLEIVDHIHGRGGHSHRASSIGRDDADNWLKQNGYRTERYDDRCHWILIAGKGTKDAKEKL